MIYSELEKRHESKMSRVVRKGTWGAVWLYAIVGVFGYLTFIDNPQGYSVYDALKSKNILEAPYGKCLAI